jgi:uncharacterized membrane protein YdbT with pleckstrin-like domain
MSYLQQVLEPGETVLHRGTVSWILYMPGLAVLILAIVLTAYAGFKFESPGWAYAFLFVLGIPAVYLIGRAWFERWITEIAITDRRIILKRGFIQRHVIEMNMDKIESIDVNQSILGRVFNYGDITVRGTGAGFEPLRMIDRPLRFRRQVGHADG